MASTVQSIAPAPLPEAPSRAQAGRGTPRGDAFAVRLDEAAANAAGRSRPGPARSSRPAPAESDVERPGEDRARAASPADARTKADRPDTARTRDAITEDDTRKPRPVGSRPARQGEIEFTGGRRPEAADEADDAATQSLADAGSDAAAKAGGETGTEDGEADGLPAAGPDDSGPTSEGAAAGDAADDDPAPAASAAVTALLNAAAQNDPPPAATAAATVAVALLQPALADVPPSPAPNDTLDGVRSAADGPNPPPPAPPALRTARTAPSGTQGASQGIDTAEARQDAPLPDGQVPEKIAEGDAAREPRTLPDLRLPHLDGARSKGGSASASPASPAAQVQGMLPSEDGAVPPAPSTAGAPGAQEPAQGGKPHPAAAVDGRTATGEVAASGQGSGQALPELQVATFSLDPASAGQTPHAAGLHRDPVSGTPAAAGPGQSPVPTPAVPVQAVPIEIGMRVLEGAQQFTVRLHPEDLGRVDVRIGVDDDGKVTAQLVVDKVETLAMLQRDARTLERAFDQAGLKTSEGSLQFTLNTGAGQQQSWSGSPERQQQTNVTAEATKIEPPEDLMAAIRRVQAGPGGLDIRI